MSIYLKNYKSFQPCSVSTAAELTHESESEIQDLVVDFLNQNSGADLDFLAVSPNHEIMFSTPLGVFIWVGDDDYEILENGDTVRKYLWSRYRKITAFYAEEIKKALLKEGMDPSSITQRRVPEKEKIILKVHYRELWDMLFKLKDQGVLPGLEAETLPARLDFTKNTCKAIVQEVADKYSIDVKQYYGDEIGRSGDQEGAQYIEVPFKPI